ncbi:ribosome biogenesis protein SLX9-domain-containing protein [Umbelopsis sp. PMI_123]|nr:ribosome biogenesis protein SLX9-domain-containing protein [Umbelopsis sp. PMI_123]
MPKVTRTRTRLHKEAAPKINERKFAVKEKEVLERIETAHNEPQIEKPSEGIEEEEGPVSKRMKRKMRHDTWMQKLDQTYNKLDNRKKKKKGKNALTVDFDDFGSVLSQIQTTDKPSEPFVRGTPTPSKKPFPDTNTKVTRKKARKANALQEIIRFQNVLQHSAFKSNPMETIKQHVQNTFQ